MAPKKQHQKKGYLYDAAHNLPINIPKRTLKRLQNAAACTSKSSEMDSGNFSNLFCST